MLTATQQPGHEAGRAVDTDNRWYTNWRRRELARLARSGTTYLDYTGSALAPSSLLRADFHRLENMVLGNPHSEHEASRASTQSLEEARTALLSWLSADPDEYAVIFTANSSAACRLVGESFRFSAQNPLVLSADNHNSVNGLREFARAKGARVHVLPLDEELRLAGDVAAQLEGVSARGRVASLFAFPAQSNFSGVRHPLSLIGAAQERGHRVLLDAAAFLPSSALRLDLVHPDFVALSLYKMIGYPSGVGALVARHEALAELERPWFAGGTVDWVSVAGTRHRLRANAERFEDGTPAFAAIGAVPRALDALRDADPGRLSRHLECLTATLLGTLSALRHDNGEPMIRIHGPRSTEGRGATVAFSVYSADGAVVPYWEVEERARAQRIALRGGCFCNPGCAEKAFAFPEGKTLDCLDALGGDFTIPRFAACLGNGPVGALRISLGLGTIEADIGEAIEFIRSGIGCRESGIAIGG